MSETNIYARVTDTIDSSTLKENKCLSFLHLLVCLALNPFPVDAGRKLNVHKTFRRRVGRVLNVLCKFNLRPVSTGSVTQILKNSIF